MSRTLHLAEQLISLPSITPEDAGCLELLASRLEPLGFVCERMDSGPPHFHVCNLWAKRPAARASQAQEAHISIAFASAWTQHEARLKCAREPLVEWSEALAARLAPYRCAPLHGATLRGWCAALAWQASGTVQSL